MAWCIKGVNRSASAAFAPDGKYMAAGTMAGAVDLQFSSSANLDIFELDFVSDDRQLILAGSAPSSERFNRISWAKGPGNSEDYSLGIIAGGLVDGSIGLWNPKALICFSDSIRRRCSVMQWNPDLATQLIVASDEDSSPTLRLWDMRNIMTPVKEFAGHTKGVIAMSWCPIDSSYLLTCAKDNRTICWDTVSGEIVAELPAGTNWNFDVHWYPKIPGVVSASSFDGKIGIYNIEGCGRYGAGESDFVAAPMRAPKWYKSKAGVSFGFGGKLVSFHSMETSRSSEVYLSNLVTEHALVSRSSEFEAAIRNGDRSALKLLCERKSQESDWIIRIGFTEKESEKTVTYENTQLQTGTTFSVDQSNHGSVDASQLYYQDIAQPQIQPAIPYVENYQQQPSMTIGRGYSAPPTYQPIRPNIFVPSEVTQPQVGPANPSYQAGPPGIAPYVGNTSQVGPVPGQSMPQQVMAPTPQSRGFIPVNNSVVQRPGIQPSSPTTQPASVQSPVTPAAPPPTVQTVDTSNVPAQQKPVISTLTRLFNETSEAMGGSRANPAKKREIEDNSKKLGALFAKLNSGDISKNAAEKLVHLCQALDKGDFSTALQIQISLNDIVLFSMKHSKVASGFYCSLRLVFDIFPTAGRYVNDAVLLKIRPCDWFLSCDWFLFVATGTVHYV
ncbi:hypothetical protein F511_13448 [Dorcoceras hygrometricum]|uniref:Uncharacterized protein n=1 Tax=Dorcoceras hygrometricum TaxID=472368 RepID=A0A2Z7AES2_9LAMI|nr:hypothetical protein F511_13448 [Dorcoceras hygrometricum]